MPEPITNPNAPEGELNVDELDSVVGGHDKGGNSMCPCGPDPVVV